MIAGAALSLAKSALKAAKSAGQSTTVSRSLAKSIFPASTGEIAVPAGR